MAKWEDRLGIRHMFVLNYKKSKSDTNSVIDIAIVTTENKYVEYELRLVQKSITYYTLTRFISLFSDYQFYSYSDVCFYNTITEKNPFYMFMQIIAGQVLFPIKTIGPDKIIGRLASVNPNYLNKPDKDGRYINRIKGNIKNMHRIWRCVMEKKKCPWITQAYDDYLKQHSNISFIARKRLLRLGAWYQVVRTYVYEKTKKCNERRKLKQINNS